MKLLRQSLIILGICFAGEVLNRLIRLPIPGNVIGMVILFVCLSTGIIKLEMINEISKFLLEHLAFFFIPSGVALIASLSVLKANLAAFITISIATTVIVTIITGHAVQILKRSFKR